MWTYLAQLLELDENTTPNARANVTRASCDVAEAVAVHPRLPFLLHLVLDLRETANQTTSRDRHVICT